MDPTSYPPPPPVPEPPVPGTPDAPTPPPPADIAPPPAPEAPEPAPPAPPVPPAPEIPPAAAPAPPAFEPPAAAPPASFAPAAPQYAPPPPPENMPPSYAAQAAPPPKKKSKVLVIVLVILGLLLLCCVGSIFGGWALFNTDPDVTSESSVDVDTGSETPDDAEAPADETGGREEWVAFQPVLADSSIYAKPTSKQAALIEEIHADLYPDFKIEDTLAEPGTEDADTYYPDMLYVKASLKSDPDVRIAYYVWTDSEASAAAGKHLSEEQTESYETLAQSASGTYYIYDHENLDGLMNGTVDDTVAEVLKSAEQEFPGYVAIIVGEDGDDIGAVLTRWSAFPDLEDGLAVTFTPDGDSWTVKDIADW